MVLLVKDDSIPERLNNLVVINNYFVNSVAGSQPLEYLILFYNNNSRVESEFNYLEINDLLIS